MIIKGPETTVMSAVTPLVVPPPVALMSRGLLPNRGSGVVTTVSILVSPSTVGVICDRLKEQTCGSQLAYERSTVEEGEVPSGSLAVT